MIFVNKMKSLIAFSLHLSICSAEKFACRSQSLSFVLVCLLKQRRGSYKCTKEFDFN